MGKGWRNESRRHSLASRGIKTAQKIPARSMQGFNRDFMLSKWETKQKDSKLFKRVLQKDYAFGERSVGEVSVSKIGLEYGVNAKLLDMKQIGLDKSDYAVTKVRMNRTKILKTEKKANELAEKWKDEISEKI